MPPGSRAVTAALLASLVAAAALLAGLLGTGSAAVRAGLVLALAAAASQVLLLVGLRRAARAASEEHPQAARRGDASRQLAEERGMRVHEVRTQGASPFERLARLVGTTDYASTYLALAQGLDPTPVDAITALKQAVSR